MKLKKIFQVKDNGSALYMVVFSNTYKAASTFMRLQEFYESSFPSIRGHFFTREQYEDTYADKMGSFNYSDEYAGFNVPGDRVKKFFAIFRDLNVKETILHEIVYPVIEKHGDRFYLIGAAKDDLGTIAHEIAHGLYYLDREYRSSMLDVIANWPHTKKVYKWLKKSGYYEDMFDDECQAYLATSDWRYIRDKIKAPHKEAAPFRKVFRSKRKEIQA